MKRKVWKKILRDKRSKKLADKKTRKRTNKGQSIGIDTPNSSYNSLSLYREAVTKTYSAPSNFSIINNPNDTIEYFNNIYDGIYKKMPYANFIIDSNEVIDVTVDALVYLIAIMENMKLIQSMKYVFQGNFPINNQANTVYEESGFVDYVQSRVKRLPNKSKMRIVSGTLNKPSVSKDVCDFIMQELLIEKQEVLFVQKILVELMSNAFHHAYPNDKTSIMYPKWYIYAEHVNNRIRIVFADTGKGIVGTVRKRFRERVFNINDEDLIYFAFQPDHFIRTETNLSHRGNGLPGIMEIINESPIESFWVFSGKGGFYVDKKYNQNKLTKLSFDHRIYGTIIVFEF